VPRISCIMPTIPSRKYFVAQAIRLFNAQTYPNKELIIIDDGEIDSVAEVIPAQENIEYLHINTLGTSAALTIGAKRNLACSVAKGKIICHMDDDDYIGPESLARRAKPIIAEKAEVTACKMSLCFDLSTHRLWRCSDDLHRHLFRYDARCGTLMYKRYFWNERSCYPNTSRGEDIAFFSLLYGAAARMVQVNDPACYICVRHGGNITDAMGYGPPEWTEEPVERYMSQEDRAFYAGMREGASV